MNEPRPELVEASWDASPGEDDSCPFVVLLPFVDRFGLFASDSPKFGVPTVTSSSSSSDRG